MSHSFAFAQDDGTFLRGTLSEFALKEFPVSTPSLLYPSPLQLGDTIGIVAPASPPEQPEVIDEAIERLSRFGFKVKLSENVHQRTGYLAGSDAERAADLNAFFADPEVKAVFALRGGYGSCRILPMLDYDAIRANPKPLVGYSDITAMHLAILVKSGLVTFHGSNASSAFTHENLAVCKRMLTVEGDLKPGAMENLFSRATPNPANVTTIVPGRAEGTIIGGNFTCLLRLIGTPWQPDFRGAILFLEDTCEKAYRIDGMFTHLRLAGILPQIAGLVLGQFDYEADVHEPKRIHECLRREAERLGVPCVMGAPIGHFSGQVIIPQGVPGELDADAGSLAFRAF
jgi:muramoyltetrapeptide carboxypeptidase